MNQDLSVLIFLKTNYGKSSKTWFDSQEIIRILLVLHFLSNLFENVVTDEAKPDLILIIIPISIIKILMTTCTLKIWFKLATSILITKFFRSCYAIFCLSYLRQNMKFLLWCYFFGLLCLDRKKQKRLKSPQEKRW